jgi:hypothetical protein
MKQEAKPWYPPSRAALDVLAQAEEVRRRAATGCRGRAPEKFTQAELDEIARQVRVKSQGSRIAMGVLLAFVGLEALAAVCVLIRWLVTT